MSIVESSTSSKRVAASSCRGSGRRSRGGRSTPAALRPLRRVARGSAAWRARARRACLARDPAALDADRVGGEAEADRGDARERRRRPAVGDQAVLRVGQLPEEAEGALLEVVEERIGVGRRRGRIARRERRCAAPSAADGASDAGAQAARQRRRQAEPPARARRTRHRSEPHPQADLEAAGVELAVRLAEARVGRRQARLEARRSSCRCRSRRR